MSTTETESGKRLAESTLKLWTGGDTVSASFLRAEFFTFRPAFKIYLAANHKPVIRGQDKALWERIHLVPFTVYIPPAERDKLLAAKLEQEADGILRWAVEGCLSWQRDGLKPPDIVLNASEEYRIEMASISEFLADRCVIQNDATVNNSDIWGAYMDWCKANGEHYPLSRREFKLSLERKNIIQKRGPQDIWQGVGLN